MFFPNYVSVLKFNDSEVLATIYSSVKKISEWQVEIEARFVMPTPCVPVKCDHIKIERDIGEKMTMLEKRALFKKSCLGRHQK